MKKILKAITFLSLVMCLMLNSNFVYAEKHPKCKKATAMDGFFTMTVKNEKGKDVYLAEFVPHDVLEILANVDNKQSAKFDAACIAIAKGLGALAGCGELTEGIVTMVRSSSIDRGDQMLLASAKNSFCGVIIYYRKTVFGEWKYVDFEAQ